MKKRAMKKWVPEGMYCHGPLIPDVKDGMLILRCPNFCRNMVGNRCRYTGVSKDDDILLWDDCKICGVKENYWED